MPGRFVLGSSTCHLWLDTSFEVPQISAYSHSISAYSRSILCLRASCKTLGWHCIKLELSTLSRGYQRQRRIHVPRCNKKYTSKVSRHQGLIKVHYQCLVVSSPVATSSSTSRYWGTEDRRFVIRGASPTSGPYSCSSPPVFTTAPAQHLNSLPQPLRPVYVHTYTASYHAPGIISPRRSESRRLDSTSCRGQ